MSLIWVTRAEPGAAETAGRLAVLGHTPLVDPVLAVRHLSGAIAFSGVDAIAFTSRNGVEAFAAASAVRDLPAYAVGDATAAAARAAGFAEVTSAEGDAQALAELIASRVRPGAVILHPGAVEPAADLPALLGRHGLSVTHFGLYETVPAEPAHALARLAEIDAVLAHSPKAARRLAALLNPVATRHLAFACISANTAEPLIAAGHENVSSARFPDEAALLKLLTDR